MLAAIVRQPYRFTTAEPSQMTLLPEVFGLHAVPSEGPEVTPMLNQCTDYGTTQ